MSAAAGIRLMVNFPSSSFRASWLQQPVFNKVQLCLWNGRPKQQVRGLEGMMDWIQWGGSLMSSGQSEFRPGLVRLYGWTNYRDVCLCDTGWVTEKETQNSTSSASVLLAVMETKGKCICTVYTQYKNN